VSSQLGNRIQHALRAFTPREQRAVKAAAETFRPNPDFKTAQVIMELGVGEALVSTLEKKGHPSVVQRTLVRPPSSRLGPLTKAERKDVLKDSPVHGVYDESVDRVSAYETLKKRAKIKLDQEEKQREQETASATQNRGGFSLPDWLGGGSTKKTTTRRRSSSRRQSTTEALTKSVARSMGTALGRALVRGVLGSLKKGY
jgi:hypothetical protein